MNQNEFANIAQLEADLWSAADNLRANSKLTAGEYCMPVLGIIFLVHATNRYNEALKEIQADQAAGNMPKRPLTVADFKKRRARSEVSADGAQAKLAESKIGKRLQNVLIDRAKSKFWRAIVLGRVILGTTGYPGLTPETFR